MKIPKKIVTANTSLISDGGDKKCGRVEGAGKGADGGSPTGDVVNTYQGKRKDLEYRSDEDKEYRTLPELKKTIWTLVAGSSNHGIIASEVADLCLCSREWARQVMNRMVDEGSLRVRRIGKQLKIYYINEGVEDEKKEES